MKFFPTKTPKIISQELKQACYKLSGREDLRYVNVKTSNKYKTNKCAYNSRDEAESVGGRVVFGWKVFIWKNVMFNFIGHAVVKLNDSYYCVTPSKQNDKEILFIPDSTITFDFKNLDSRLPTKDVAISKRPEVKRLLIVREQIRAIKIKYPVSSSNMHVSIKDGNAIAKLERLQSDLVNRVNYFLYPAKDNCPCDSGKQFRKCCKPFMKKAYG